MDNLIADGQVFRERRDAAATTQASPSLSLYETPDALPAGQPGIDPNANQAALMAALQSFDLESAPRVLAPRPAATNLNNNLGALTSGQQAIVSFVSNANPDLTAANPSFSTYENGVAGIDTPQATLQAGTTITYAFQPGSYTAAQQADIEQAMAAWSGVCNVTFSYVANYSADPTTGYSTTAELSLMNMNNNANGEFDQVITSTPTAQPNVTQDTQEIIVTDMGGNYGTLGDYATGGFGQGAILHELGHVLGLGHTGSYNGGTTAQTDAGQTNAYDTQAWSVMSYVDPSDPNAKYYAQSATPGANYQGNAGTGPMGLDIYAVQRLYGAPTSTMFSGGQIFGFNSNITYTTPGGTTALMEMYNFAVNINPVVTLYDYGTGNTLDLAGFSTNDTVNLNAGSFSSANGYVDNIFIEYGTAIDGFVAGSGNDSVTVNSQADTITGGIGADTVVFADPYADYSFARSGNALDVTGFGVTDTLSSITTLQFSDRSVLVSSIQCYSRGTRIETPVGDIEIEALAAGDLVFTASGRARPIRWIGTRSFDPRFAGRNPKILPIRICRDALADGIPRRDLLVSPEHAMLIDGVLVAAKYLTNGVSIRQEDPGATIDYFHLELDTHDAILAEGAASETYIEDGDRGMFRNAPALRARTPAPPRYCAERIEPGPRLEAIRTELDARAGVQVTITEEPDIHLLADGAIILQRSGADGELGFDLPCAARDLVLVSRRTPGAGADRRGLGIAVAGITIDGTPIDLATMSDRGWHALERDGSSHWRWTDGTAQLPPTTQPCRITIQIAGTLRYRQFARAA